jgi:protease II
MANMAPEQYKGQSGSFDRLKEVAVEYGFFCMAGNRQQSNKAERE